MNIDHPSIQGLIRAATVALYARAMKDAADASRQVDGLGPLLSIIGDLVLEDVLRPLRDRKKVG